jgi:hypothetical protein
MRVVVVSHSFAGAGVWKPPTHFQYATVPQPGQRWLPKLPARMHTPMYVSGTAPKCELQIVQIALINKLIVMARRARRGRPRL